MKALRFVALALPLVFLRSGAEDLAPPGHKPEGPGVHALVGVTAHVRPGEAIENATIVIRDGRIEAVGAGLAAPADARVWDGKGLTVYAGFIDAYQTPKAEKPQGRPGRGLTSGKGFFGVPGGEKDPGAAGPGHAIARITPERRMAAQSALDAKAAEGWREAGLTAVVWAPEQGILRGTSALVLLGDGNPNDLVAKADVFLHAALERGSRGDDSDAFPDSLMGQIAAIRQALLDADWAAKDQAHFAANPGRPRPEYNPSLEALAPALARARRVVFETAHGLGVDQVARIAEEFGLDTIVVASGQEWRRPDLVKAPVILPLRCPTLPQLPDDADWDQVTLDQLRAWDWAPEVAALLRKNGVELALTTNGLDAGAFRKNLRQALDRGLSEADALAALTTAPARMCGVEGRMGTVEKGKLANLTVVEGSYFDPDARVRGVWVEGRWFENQPGAKGKEAEAEPKTEEERAKRAKAKEEADRKKAEAREAQRVRAARAPSEDRPEAGQRKFLLVKGATVWTCGPQGRIVADILIEGGRIERVAPNIEAREGVGVIDATGLHVTPGIIDCHSHSMIVGDVNEGTLPSSAMVRIGDVVNSETDRIHEQLAGGLTIANLLHGSANPIGGQNCVIKLRDGASPAELVFREAPQGIKFALGENVKQSNWGEKHVTRYPQTRMGVRTFMENRFTAARRYQAERAAKSGPPARRDLELEALAEILEGTRLIHCHSYRADEILMLIRLMEDFKVRIGTFQHVLEGYKVADEIAAHGAGGSCFSDWWAYKFEVYDAIPHAGSLMRERGVVVSFNSDSGDHARRLYLEAAKAVKYGGTTEEDALKFVTLNPAIQLGIAKRVGSIEEGKDADFAIWSKSPLDSGTMCLETWIEGRKFFDRAWAETRAAARQKERDALIAKAKRVAESGGGGGGGRGDGPKFWETALEKENDGARDVHCGGACEQCEEGGR